jgi:hypothetical protein
MNSERFRDALGRVNFDIELEELHPAKIRREEDSALLHSDEQSHDRIAGIH